MEVVEREISLTRRGEATEVVEAIDPPFVERLELSAPAALRAKKRAVVRISRSNGCSLEVKSSDPAWLYSARETISDEIRRNVPWWAYLRWPLAQFVSGGILYLALVLAVWDNMTLRSSSTGNILSTRTALLIYATIGIPVILLIAGAIRPLLHWLIPGLEIVAPGTTPKSGKALAFIGTMALSFLLGIIVNLITP